jgi:hypothetical protein
MMSGFDPKLKGFKNLLKKYLENSIEKKENLILSLPPSYLACWPSQPSRPAPSFSPLLSFLFLGCLA